ncbi:hypothetical protein [Tissierella sp.]|uniref:hypothetical protein n=1 Tax=Tissierella sp. TaxID=41274 RepID=UPI0028586F20|nr:hypothetical protein [Tissierella sp.]MDR7855180.1 hypothetical protein [Tissierella sp.]
MKWLRKFMSGRYGGDQLSTLLVVLSLLITLLGRWLNIRLIMYLSYIPLYISIFRMFSKDIEKRRLENYKFAIFMSPLYSRFKRTQKHVIESKTHKFYKCPECKTKLRLPKGKGKIVITCPKCKNKFEKRT